MIAEKCSFTCDQLISHRQIACCPTYFVIPYRYKELLCYSMKHHDQKPLSLTGHHGDIGAMVFGRCDKQILLCSASADYVIVWNIELCERRISNGLVAAGTVIGTLLGNVVSLSFSPSDERVAACSGSTVIILDSQREQVISTLSGHLGPLTAAAFCPWEEQVLVTISEDRTFKVWDLKTESVCYQSFVLSASPLLSCVFVENSRHFITGSSDGQMWSFTFPNDHNCHLVAKMDTEKMHKRYLRHQETIDQQAGVRHRNQADEQMVEIRIPVLRMASCISFDDVHDQTKREHSWLWIGSSDGLYLVDLATSELLTAFHFRDYPELSISMAGSWFISSGSEDNMVCLVSSSFTPTVVLLEIRLADSIDGLCDHLKQALIGGEGLTVIPSSAPLPESPLYAELRKKEQKCPKRKGHVLKDYPTNSTAPSILHKQLGVANTSVCCFQYSGDGKQILCGLRDSSVLLYKSTLTGIPAVYTGHDDVVSSVDWSHCRQWWLSASKDRTLRVWPSDASEPAISLGPDKLSQPINSAQFYYLDKFLLLACGNSLHLYLYHVDDTHDDIKRYKQRSVIKLARHFKTTSATDITALSAVNHFFSYIVLQCGSDRSIQVLDMNKGTVAAEWPDAHSRAIHSIAQNKGSAFTTQSPDYNLFITSAVTDGIKLWDLRTLRCVRRYENHLNRFHACNSTISPCGRFIASGSEDNCAYVYDIRGSSYLHKIQEHSDSVLCVAFHPAMPELLTGTLDGKLSVFRPSGEACVPADTTGTLHGLPTPAL